MYPILFAETETAFDTNGLGVLTDTISCTVVEERNGLFELEMQYPIEGLHFAQLQLRRLVLAKPNPVGQPQPFRIYRITRPMNGLVTVYAQHLSYDLTGYPVAPFEGGSVAETFIKMQQAAVVPCPFSFWTDKETVARMGTATPASMRALLGGSEGSILDVYGGEYEFDRFAVKLYNSRGRNRGVSIRYGKNLTDLAQEENCSTVYTGVYPFWHSDQDGLVQLDERIVPAEGSYDFVRILPLDLSGDWQEPPTPDQLRSRAVAYMKANDVGVPRVSLTVSFVQLAQSEEYRDLALLEAVHLCDTVNVEFPKLKVSATSKCVSTTYDVLTGKYAKIELGAARASLASTIAAQGQAVGAVNNKTQTFVERTVDYVTKLFTGNLGGTAILHSSTGGQAPDELLFLDTDDIHTAQNVWRFNARGWGHSTTGYNGAYTMSATADDTFSAEAIVTAALTATLARAELLQSLKGRSLFNLDTRRLVLEDDGGQQRGLWPDAAGDIVGLFDRLCAVEQGQTEAFGAPYFRVTKAADGPLRWLQLGPDDCCVMVAVSADGSVLPTVLLRHGQTEHSVAMDANGDLSFGGNVRATDANRAALGLRNAEVRATDVTGALQSTDRLIYVRK